ncbi:MAG: GNAT family N-acetyltransferase [Oscillospiraceae bacterium]|nr:GNAT family N-acetyltransferase [Oscillospiraceae bacterium]
MDVEIRRLTPDLAEDYLYFFDHVGFTDHPEWSQCYCLHFHFEPAWDAEDEGRDHPWRERAARLVREGKLQGYFAYADGQVAGWCNANDRENFCRLVERKELWDEASRGKRVKSIVCFIVAPALRGQGIATRLLERACEDAKREGYDFLEAYPVRGRADRYAHHHGPPKLYKKFGFTAHKKYRRDCVMRRDLKGQ